MRRAIIIATAMALLFSTGQVLAQDEEEEPEYEYCSAQWLAVNVFGDPDEWQIIEIALSSPEFLGRTVWAYEGPTFGVPENGTLLVGIQPHNLAFRAPPEVDVTIHVFYVCD